MKYLEEYRDPELSKAYLKEIERISSNGNSWGIMEFCGGQTHSLVKNGIVNLLPPNINLIHGPGCPVCVTPVSTIDQAIELASQKDVILCSFGDMLRVPGSTQSLLDVKAAGGNVKAMYSPMDAVQIAREIPDKEIVFFAVGFETTAPANALSVLHAELYGLENYSLLTSHVLVPPAIEAVLNEEDSQVDGILGAGHVCSVIGIGDFDCIVADYKIPIVVTGFEPVDLLQGILMTIQQLENREAKLENQYSRVVPPEGNPKAKKVVERVFEVCDKEWRGIGMLPMSGWQIRPEFAKYDAVSKFGLKSTLEDNETECIAGEILKGAKKPMDCPHFGKQCTPVNPIGAPMVSSEGACAAYYHFSNL